MWETIFRARAAYRESNPVAPAIIEPARWPLPGAQELGPVNTGILFMLQNARGRGIPLVNATAASNIERTRVESRAVGITFGGSIGLAGGGAGTAGAGAGAVAGVSSPRDEAGYSREGAGPAGAGRGRGRGRGRGLPAAKRSKRAGAGPTGARAAAGPAGAEVSSPEDEPRSSKEGAGPAGAGRGRGRGRGRGLPAAKQSKRAAAGPTGARATAGPAGAEVSSPEDEAGSSREGAGPAEAEVEGKGRGQERERGLPTARRSKKFVRRRGVGPRASVPPPSTPPPSLPLPPPGMQIVPVSIPRPSIGKLTSTAGMPGGPSAALK